VVFQIQKATELERVRRATEKPQKRRWSMKKAAPKVQEEAVEREGETA